jgi:hypothetical protein
MARAGVSRFRSTTRLEHRAPLSAVFYNRAANEMFVFGGGDSGIMSVPGDLWVFVLSRFGRRLAK